MEKFDRAAQQRVWQRVSAPASPQREDLRPLILSAQEAAADFRFLMGQLKGPQSELARKLWEGAQETAACLRGLQQLRAVPTKPLAQPCPQANLPRLLEQSYHRARRLAVEFTARSADPESGMVFARLAQREQENCVKIAVLMGQVGK